MYDAQQRPITLTRLVADTVNGHTLVTPLTATMQYNADGLRSDYLLTPDPRTGKQPVDTRFAYRAGGELAAATITDLTGTLLYKNTFIYDPGGNPLELIRTNPDGTTSRYWYVLDGLGSVVALTDINGTVVDRYAYDSWGEETSDDATDETVPQQLRYRGYYYDEKLTWYWVTTRYYDPEGMRWLQPDPSDIDGVRTYTYVGDDPVDASDPTGEIGYPVPPTATCGIAGLQRYCGRAGTTPATAAIYMFLVGDDLQALTDPNYDPGHLALKALALVDITSNATLIIPVGGEAAKGGAKLAFLSVKHLFVHELGVVSRDEAPRAAQAILEQLAKHACRCFPAGTRVATPHGGQPIQTLHVGDQVLAEDPKTGKVDVEPVREVIKDPVSPLIAIDLSDGSAITVTADHPFWVDKSASRGMAGWRQAGQLRPGDQLRTVESVAAIVTGLRRNVGHAVVYTLTVAHDHTYFVGTAHILVHNACPYNFAPGKLTEHLSHLPEYGYGNITEAAYLKRAQNLLSRPAGGDIEEFVRPNGDVLRYDVRTNEFAARTSSGVIKTLFRPRNGIEYWLVQTGRPSAVPRIIIG